MRNVCNRLAFSGLLLIAGIGRSQAQAPATVPQRMAFHVEGMTAEERDAISVQLAEAGAFRIAYACVPAGIIVIEPIEGRPAGQAPVDHAALVRARIGTKVMTVDHRSMAELENDCLNVRNQ